MRKLIIDKFDTINKQYGLVDDQGKKCFLTTVECGGDPLYSIITKRLMVYDGTFRRSNIKNRIYGLVDEGFIVQIYEFDTSDELLNWLNDE